MAPILTVVGATGIQGGSVVNTLLEQGIYKIRGITRNAESSKAKALAERGVEVVVADLNDEESLVKAFHGSTAIFAVTDFFVPFYEGGPELGLKVERQQGKNLASAASKTSSLEHYIWSTLPDTEKITNGNHSIPHLMSKTGVDPYVKANKELLAKTTFLWVTWYVTNYIYNPFKPCYSKTVGKYVQIQAAPPETPVLSIGDASKNVGVYAKAILAQPQVTRGGKYVIAYNEETTIGGLLETWSKVTGKPSVYVQTTSLKAFDDIWPVEGYEMGGMLKFWEEAQDKSWSGEELLTGKDLNIESDKLVTIEETYKSMDWDAVL